MKQVVIGDEGEVSTFATPSGAGARRLAYNDGGPLVLPAGAPTTLCEALARAAGTSAGMTYIQSDGGATFQSYADLQSGALRMLGGLRHRGLKKGDRVVLQIDSLPHHYLAFWACVLGGITPVTVAVAPTYRARNGVNAKLLNTWELLRRPFVLATRGLVSQIYGLAEVYPMEGLRVLPVEDLLDHQEVEPSPDIAPDDLAFFQLTSGSTGVPKCIQETHRGILRHAHATAIENSYSSADITLNWLALDHVVPILTCHLKDVVMMCAQIQVKTVDVLAEPLLWLDLIERYRVTHTWSPNFGFKLVSGRLAAAGAGRSWDLSSMRRFMNAGEQVTLPVVRDFLVRLAPFGVREDAMQPAFGMAEVCTCMTYTNDFSLATGVHHVLKSTLDGTLEMAKEGTPGTAPFVDLGPPFLGVEIRIADAQARVLPEDTIGRLHIRGGVVTPGYLDNPAANLEAFPGDGWLDSGDLGFMHLGRLTLTGRAKEMIIVRGANYFCYEIEDVVANVAGVRATFVAAVAVDDPKTGSEALAIFFVPNDGEAAEPERLIVAIRSAIAAQIGLPTAHVVALDSSSFLKTTSGKIQRTEMKKRLLSGVYDAPAAAPAAPARGVAVAGKDAELEIAVIAIWEEVLETRSIGPDQSFFELGGHSLAAMQIVARLRSVFGAEITLRDLFEGPTVRELVVAIAARRPTTHVPTSIPRLPRGPGETTFPLSFGQERLFFLDQWDPGGAALNEAFAFRIEGALDPAAMARAVQAIVDRHEILRTTFTLSDTGPVQRIAATLAVACPLTDLTGTPGDREAHALAVLAEGARAPFDLRRGPLLRTSLLRVDAEVHFLSLTMHHIVTDGWSFDVFLNDLIALYQAFTAGKASPLRELPIQYADFAVWQRGQQKGPALEARLAFWRRTLGGNLPVLELPTDRPRPAVQRYRGSKQVLAVPDALARALQSFAEKHQATPFLVLQTAFRVLLHRWSGQEDLVVGCPTAGRNRIETEHLIGFFTNQLVLRTDLADGPTFRALLERVREAALSAYANEDVPFEKLIEAEQTRRDTSRSPLFQVFFNLLRFADHRLDDGKLRLHAIDLDRGTSNFDLTLYAIEVGAQLSFALNYNTDLFDAETATRMLAQLATLLSAALADPDRRIAAYPLLTEAERHAAAAARASMIRPAKDFAPMERPAYEQTIHQRFEAQARAFPDRIAVSDGAATWTYAELNRKANRVARRLIAEIGPGAANVALLFSHGAPMIAGMLGALKAGKAYVPIEPGYPRERLDFLLGNSEARAIVAGVTEAPLAVELGRGALPLVHFGDDDPADSEENLDLAVAPDALAYLLYTSGSTGRPKGVMQNHRNVLHFIRAYVNNLAIGPQDRLVLLASFGFDAAVMDIYAALFAGAELHPIDVKETGFGALARTIEARRITVYHSTPTLYRHLLAVAPRERGFPDVRLVVLGGEEAVRRDLEAFRERFPLGAVLINGLGPTESTVTLQAFFDGATRTSGNTLAVGYPVDDTGILLLDAEGKPGKIRGEIAIRSAFTALGYWRSPELSAAAFRPDPEGGTTRIYRTGDLGRILPDGQLEFLGRRDHQVKIRGIRIEPGEIETTLSTLAAVRESVVIARDDATGARVLVAYVVAPGATVAELRAYLQEKLPAPLVPAMFVLLDALPLTSTGKIDRLALPAPIAAPAAPTEVAAPEQAIQVRLQRIWERVLNVPTIGVHEDFFDRGGHSLLALRLFMEIEKDLGKALPLAVLFRAPTIAALAAVLAREGVESSWPSLVPIESRGTRTPFFCVHAIGANVLNYRLLSRHLGEEQPFYGLQSRGLDGAHAPHDSLEEMAAAYVSEVRAVQPHGPYLIGGGSSGGIVAWEMAQQLRAAGEEVALLALIDTYQRAIDTHAPRTVQRASFLHSLAQRLDFELGRLVMNDHGAPLRWLADEARRSLERVTQRTLRQVRGGADPDALPPLIQRVRAANIHAILSYSAKPYAGKATLFLTLREPVRAADDRRLLWSELCQGGLELHTLPSDHNRVLDDPDVAVLAAKLRACIARATAAPHDSTR
ncbi:MAG: amino acid adenylation domain-containing protein [Byssovorax sp.]